MIFFVIGFTGISFSGPVEKFLYEISDRSPTGYRRHEGNFSTGPIIDHEITGTQNQDQSY
jgi:hypothetical protein